MQALLDPGDEVIIPAPYWVTYPEQVQLADGKPVFVPTLPENDFMPTRDAVRAAITPRTKALILNSPSNPTGGVASRQTLKELASLCIQHDLYLISDEIYEKLLYDGREHLSPGALGEEIFQRTITVNGCSKAYSMTGWRIGYAAAADTELIAAMGRLQDQSTSNPTSIAQKAAVAALNGPQEPVETMRRAFEERRNLIVENLNAIPGVTCRMPGGAFYAFPDMSGLLGKRVGEKRDRGLRRSGRLPAGRGAGRRRSRLRLRRGPLYSPLLRHVHRQHCQGPGAHRRSPPPPGIKHKTAYGRFGAGKTAGAAGRSL